MSKQNRVDCFKCKYFYITWEQENPRACRFFGFKTKLIPSVAVMKSSGNICQAFKQKNRYDKGNLQ